MSFQIYFCKWFCEGSSQTVPLLHTAYPGDKNTWSVKSARRETPDPAYMKRIRVRHKHTGPSCSGKQRSSTHMQEEQPYFDFLLTTERLSHSQKMKITKCWHEPGTGGGGVKNHLYPHPSHYSSQFPTSPSPSLPAFLPEESFHLSFFL